jgi:UDP-2-acetamido-2,6-beta-L-arabino-hexul-4-ose reductase
LNIVITGSSGFIGKNLRSSLENYDDHNLILLDRNSSKEDLRLGLQKADFIFHLAGVNRPLELSEFEIGNIDYTKKIVDTLLSFDKSTPIVFSSSIQVDKDNHYGSSKKAAESLLIDYSISTGARIHILRLPNVFGKWAKPYYNSVVATFCNNIIRQIPLEIHDSNNLIKLLHIDHVVSLMMELMASLSSPQIINDFPSASTISVGDLESKITQFHKLRGVNKIPNLLSEFDKQLFSTYSSYLPLDFLTTSRRTNISSGSLFTELLKTNHSGQFSLNIIEPGVTKGNHWHHTKHEKYIVIQGTAKVRLRYKFEKEIDELILTSNPICSIDIPPGVVHSIENIGNQELITIMWANEIYDSENPDTFKEDVMR